jgi:alpha-beta hydrolase superfamily lysophospholipase
MQRARTAWLAGAASAGIAFLIAGCDDEPRSRIADDCAPPEGTIPLVFTSARRQLFGFIDPPPGDGPHPAILLLHDSGRTDITRGNGDFAELREAFRAAGIAPVVWDAAGSGCSGGRYRGLADLYVRADDVLAAVDELSARDDIDASRIGAWAIGEGAWVAPMAAARRDVLDFLILVGGPGGDAIERTAYFARRNLEREGYDPDEAQALADRLKDALTMMRDQAPYRDYRASVAPLSDHPLLPSMSELGGDVFPSERRYDELRESAVLHVEPSVFLSALEIPVFAIWGEHDQWGDRERAEVVYRQAFAAAANDDATIKVVEGADHALCAVKDDEPGAEQPGNSCRLARGYVDAMTAWLERYGFTGTGERQSRAARER